MKKGVPPILRIMPMRTFVRCGAALPVASMGARTAAGLKAAAVAGATDARAAADVGAPPEASRPARTRSSTVPLAVDTEYLPFGPGRPGRIVLGRIVLDSIRHAL